MSGHQPEFSQKRSGAYFTPEEVAAALVSWVDPGGCGRLLDPSCGDGEFLIQHRFSVGVEQNSKSAAAAIQRSPWSLVHEGDFFTWASETSERFECAAGNPPFIRYQTFSGETRKRALELCSQWGAQFSGLASSWAPFLVAAASLLKPNGRMAFVVPAEIGHAPYAAPLLEFLLSNFSSVQIVAVREKLFPRLSEDCWLLFVEGWGGKASCLKLTVQERFKPSSRPPNATIKIDLTEWRTRWNRRLRPYFLDSSVRHAYEDQIADFDSNRFGRFASIGIGYVTGANEFFHLRPSEAKRLKLPAHFLQPTLRNGRALSCSAITESVVKNWYANDDPVLLLRLGKDQEISSAVRRYLDSSAGREARLSYKCRSRSPWYSVPDVQIPDYMLSYMSGRTAVLAANVAKVTCTNSVHAVRIKDSKLARRHLKDWATPFVRLSCELEGHALGGGMLKLEPREAANVLFPSQKLTICGEALEDGITTLQRWRHYDKRS